MSEASNPQILGICQDPDGDANPPETQDNSADAAPLLLENTIETKDSKSIARDANDRDGFLSHQGRGKGEDLSAEIRRRKAIARQAFRTPLTPAEKAEEQACYPALDIGREHWAFYRHNTSKKAQRHVITRDGAFYVREGNRWTAMHDFFRICRKFSARGVRGLGIRGLGG
jgi:hypothetical protein